jgi:hypothetical protein
MPGPHPDLADLCPQLVPALGAELDEGEHDGQAAKDGADRREDRGPAHGVTVAEFRPAEFRRAVVASGGPRWPMSAWAGYLPHMVDSIARVVRIRTTSDRVGYEIGIVTGMGATPEQALTELWRDAQARLQQPAEPTRRAEGAAKPHPVTSRPLGREPNAAGRRVGATRLGKDGRVQQSPVPSGPQELRYEVVDVRLTPVPVEGGKSSWLAYGTLAGESESQQPGTIGRVPGSDSRSQGTR